MNEQNPVYSLQVNVIDIVAQTPDPFYDPISLPNSSISIKEVPVVRIFGVTPYGERGCLLIHGFMPHIYIDCPILPEERGPFTSEVLDYISSQFGPQIIFDTEVVMRTSIYGYSEEAPFLRLTLLAHGKQVQLSQHLSSFLWKGQSIKVYQGHISPVLQFFAATNLTGCGVIKLSQVRRKEACTSTYDYELATSIECILNARSEKKLLGHLSEIWDIQKALSDIYRVTQVTNTQLPRDNFIFTQRVPEPEESQPLTLSQEFQDLLAYLQDFDPDVELESVEKDEIKSQLEIDSIMDNSPLYETPSHFIPGRICQAPSSQHIKQQTVDCFADTLVRDKFSNVLKAPEKSSASQSQMQTGHIDMSIIDPSKELKILYLEIGCAIRGTNLPNPEHDSVICACLLFVSNRKITREVNLYVGQPIQTALPLLVCEDEGSLISKLVQIINAEDPDILIGYQIERGSFGYIDKRSRQIGHKRFYAEISRTKEYHEDFNEGKKVEGRVLFNYWRVIRSTLTLRDYNLETAANFLLGQTTPEPRIAQMNDWIHFHPHLFVASISRRVKTVFEVSVAQNIIQRYCEQSLVLGTDFASTSTRGSQFFVESLMYRIAEHFGFILYSPTRQDVASMPVQRSVPLVMEPLSGLYMDPVLVIDFQSLYPSSIIAYNLCFSTVVGKSAFAETGGQLGCTKYKCKQFHKLAKHHHLISTPNDVLFVTNDVRKGILPIMLESVLALRSMVKKTLKQISDPAVKLLLDSRQMSLKLLAACTYGYTGASYSGRMPCIEIADSIVECSRAVLEFVLQYLDQNYPDLTVLYGDTDSLFIKLEPASKEATFAFAEALCNDISRLFPHPMKIKIEKIFRGCIIVNKKRYCGWIYESVTQEKPVMHVKGLEMKRRDSCLLVAHCLTDVVESIFKTSSLKYAEFVFSEWIDRICSAQLPLNVFFFAKEVKLGSYRKQEPPSAIVGRKMMEKDPMATPLQGERIRYVVVAAPSSVRLVDRVMSPTEFLATKSRLAIRYYVLKQIVPALGRILETMGVDIRLWIKNRSFELKKPLPYESKKMKANILDIYGKTMTCPLCHEIAPAHGPVCSSCLAIGGRVESLYELIKREKENRLTVQRVESRCSECIGFFGVQVNSFYCESCPFYWERSLAEEQANVYGTYIQPLTKIFSR